MTTTKMQDLVLVGVFPPELQAIIDNEFRCHSFESVAADDALRSRIEGIITRSNVATPAAVIEGLPNLKIIATSGVGFDGIPLELARRRGVAVTNTPGVLDDAVCELGVGLLLALLRKLPDADRFVRAGRWAAGLFPLTTTLAGKTVGIVGLGRLGRGLAERLAPFGVQLAYSGSRKKLDAPYQYFENPRDLAAAVDILFVTCPGGKATEKLISAPILAALGSEGFLISLARGSVVDEAALIHALETGGIKGAALDVYNDEPTINPAFFQLPNTVLTPHVGSATRETRRAMLDLTLENLRAVLGGAAPLTPVGM